MTVGTCDCVCLQVHVAMCVDVLKVTSTESNEVEIILRVPHK